MRQNLRFARGAVDEIVESPHPALAWNFALKAEPATWERFLQDPPPPEFHDIWAAAWLGHLTLEGDMKVFMQNHFAFWRIAPHESGLVQMNMYECPDPAQTSGFGAFSLTYLTVEVAGHDSQTAEGTMSLPGRYWVGYWNSSSRMRTFAREQAGIPALAGECTWTIEGDRLVSRLSVDGATVIEATARVGSEETGVLGGHLNYYAHREIPAPAGGTSAISELLEIPIPFIAHLREAQVENVEFRFPEGSPFARLAPLTPLEIGGVLHSRVTFTYSMTRRIRDYLAE